MSKKLKKSIDDLTVRTVEFSSSKEKVQFLKYIMFDKPTEQGKSFLSTVSKSFSLEVKNSPASFILTGNLKAIEEGINALNKICL